MNCKEVWREVSNYLDNTISPELRRQMELHLSTCRNCCAIIDGVHNIVLLLADDRLIPLPGGFDTRLRSRLQKEISSFKRYN